MVSHSLEEALRNQSFIMEREGGREVAVAATMALKVLDAGDAFEPGAVASTHVAVAAFSIITGRKRQNDKDAKSIPKPRGDLLRIPLDDVCVDNCCCYIVDIVYSIVYIPV